METPQRKPSQHWHRSIRIVAPLGTAVFIVVALLAGHRNMDYHSPGTCQYLDYGVLFRPPSADARGVRMAALARNKALAKMRRIRSLWRPWALGHRAMLGRMRSSQPADLPALIDVWSSLPILPGFGRWKSCCGQMTPSALSVGWPDVMWRPVVRAPLCKTRDPIALAADRQDKRLNGIILRADFKRERDIEIAITDTPGIHKIVLWVSGRITEISTEHQSIPGKLAWVPGPTKELSPPYDFLSLEGRKKLNDSGR